MRWVTVTDRISKRLVHHSTAVMMSVVLAATLVACTTTKRAVELVVDHHVGMVRGAWDIVSGEAEAQEQRIATVRADLEQSGALLAAEQDQDRLVAQLRQHAALQDALLAELLQGHGGHGHQCGGHQQAHVEHQVANQAETTDEQPESHQH